MDQTHTGPEAQWSSQNRRDQTRYAVNLPASIKIASSEMTKPFQIKDVTICDAGETGMGLSLTIETQTSREELSRMLAHRRTCYVICQFPSSERPSRMYGEIMWVQPSITSRGVVMHMGVNLTTSQPGTLTELNAFLEKLKETGRGETA